MKAVCTWGDGPDVMLVLGGTPLILYHDPENKDSFTYGICSQGALELTADEAIRLARELEHEANKSKQLDKEYIEEMKDKNNDIKLG